MKKLFRRKKKIRCAIVGLGRIGSTLEFDRLREKPASHAGAIARHPECELVGGCDINPAKREAFRTAWGCSKLYSDYGQMLKECEIDILHIATPPETHFDILKAALKHNVPVIVCEKPLAADLSDAQKMAKMAKLSNSKILVNHERRYALNYAHVKRIIQSQRYGRVVSLWAKVFMGYRAKAKDVLLHDGTHMIDLLHYLMERDLAVKFAMGDPLSNSYPLCALLKAGEVPVFLEVGPGRDHIVFEIDVSFEFGRIVVGNGIYEEFESDVSPFYENMRSLKRKKVIFKKTEYFSRMFDDAVAIFKGEKRIPTSSIDDGYRAMKVIDEIVRRATR
ncbi:MAG: Gfo/Idh/MocA family oxidoreductase [Spirochaetes bacterium]|nr:Gfo/Idh/MocA family oxidoreductase [Spirochaetota bacterium]